MIINDIIEFLKKVPPFEFLDEETLTSVASQLTMEYYPRNTIIFKQNDPPSTALRIIKKGGVKVYVVAEDGEQVVIDYRGEGDNFGFLSMVGQDKVRSNIVAIDDTICYLLEKESLLKLLESNSSFVEYFLKSHITKYIDKTYSEMRKKTLLYGGGDRILFTTQIGDISSKLPVTVLEDLSIRDAALRMSKEKISSLIIVDETGMPTGIITDRDLREKVVAKGRDVEEPVKKIMTLPLIRVDSRDYCFEAVLKMIKFNIHHLMVIREGKLVGVVTNHDLMMLQGASPLSLAKDIDGQHTIGGLASLSSKINAMVGLLIKEGAKASNITRIITEINDRLVRKILENAERRYGPSPVPYCWAVFGSEGRKEQTFKIDQDNAIIYADPDDDAEAEEARKYFADFSVFVRDALINCGFPPCSAGYMASNPEWRQPLKVWKKKFTGWVANPTAEAVLKSLIFFDMRGLHGDFMLVEQLKDALNNAIEESPVFLGYMANTIIKNRPPIGFFNTFVVEKSGEHKNELNLKVKGIAPFVDILRLFALEKGVKETGTLDRLHALKDKHTLIEEYADDIEMAFEFIMFMRIHMQYEQIESGKQPDNFLNPDRLSNLEKRTVKDAFSLITKLQDHIIERYKAMIW